MSTQRSHRISWSIVAILGALIPGAPAVLAAGEPAPKKVIELRLDNVASGDSIQGQDCNFFAEQIDKLSNGRVKLRVYHQGALTGGSGQVALEQVIAGTLDFSYPSTGY